MANKSASASQEQISTGVVKKPTPLQCHNFFCVQNPNELYPTTFAGQSIYFCQHCYYLYEKKNCCYFCGQVYSSDEQNFLDGKDWIMCDAANCGKWMHIDCETNDGIGGNISYYIKDPTYKYSCPWCRVNNRPISQSKPGIKRERKSSQFYKRMEIQLDKFQPTPHESTITRTEPIQIRTTRFEDMLKRYGGNQLAATKQQQTDDLCRLRAVCKQG